MNNENKLIVDGEYHQHITLVGRYKEIKELLEELKKKQVPKIYVANSKRINIKDQYSRD